MRSTGKKEYSKLLPYLEKDIKHCLYLYMDLLNGEKEKADMEVWVQGRIEEPEIVLLRYYESFQIYSRYADINLQSAAEIMAGYHPKMISGPEPVIRKIAENNQTLYRAEYGAVYEVGEKKRLRISANTAPATESDVPEIVELICMDKALGGHYEKENLICQMRNRIHAGTGRSYIIREEGRIVAHTATYAETADYAVTSGTIVHPKYREKGYYPVISSHMEKVLKDEGKRIYTFALSPNMIHYHDTMDQRCGNYGKLTPKPGER